MTRAFIAEEVLFSFSVQAQVQWPSLRGCGSSWSLQMGAKTKVGKSQLHLSLTVDSHLWGKEKTAWDPFHCAGMKASWSHGERRPA